MVAKRVYLIFWKRWSKVFELLTVFPPPPIVYHLPHPLLYHPFYYISHPPHFVTPPLCTTPLCIIHFEHTRL